MFSRRFFPALVAVFLLPLTAPVCAEEGKGVSSAVLTVSSPVSFQVIQRDEKGMGHTTVSGSASVPVTEVRYRVSGKPALRGELADTWKTIAIDPKTRRFQENLELPAGGWYRLEVAAHIDGREIARSGPDQFGVGEVFVIAGQSNAGNYGSEKQRTKTGLVSGFDGSQWRPANDPQRGAGGDGGSFIPAFGDALATQLGVPIGIVPLAAGGTSVREWLPKGVRFKQQTTTGGGVTKVGDEFESNGALFEKLAKVMQTLGKSGFRAVLWHQGESDAGQARGGYPADRQISGAQYAGFMTQLIKASRERAGWEVPWLTAVTTYHSEQDAADEEFRAAMQNLWKYGLAAPGPDTDALRAEFRDGVHFNAKGLQRHGELWAEKVGEWMKPR